MKKDKLFFVNISRVSRMLRQLSDKFRNKTRGAKKIRNVICIVSKIVIHENFISIDHLVNIKILSKY